jgi:ABC-type phosphate transport system substrate-binding protein
MIQLNNILRGFLIASLLLTTACATQRNTQQPGNNQSETTSGPIDNTGRDGSSFDLAIIVNSISEEYAWIRKTYPGSQVNAQALVRHDGKHFDVLTFTTSDGETRKAYFDISRFFGKGF